MIEYVTFTMAYKGRCHGLTVLLSIEITYDSFDLDWFKSNPLTKTFTSNQYLSYMPLHEDRGGGGAQGACPMPFMSTEGRV